MIEIISAHLHLYRRFPNYIDLPTKADNKKEVAPANILEQPALFMLLYSFFSLSFLQYALPHSTLLHGNMRHDKM